MNIQILTEIKPHFLDFLISNTNKAMENIWATELFHLI